MKNKLCSYYHKNNISIYDKAKEGSSMLLYHIENQLNKLNLSFDGIDVIDHADDDVEDEDDQSFSL